MCGRYTLKTPVSELQKQFGLTSAPTELKPRFNIAPSQEVAIVTQTQPHTLQWARWGLIPSWAKDAKMGYKMINARGETLSEKPAYRQLVKKKRCWVLADGFYEWKVGPHGKTPMYIFLPKHKPFAMAGLFDVWTDALGNTITSCTIVTTSANAAVAPVHDRMPVLLSETSLAPWLDSESVSWEKLQSLLTPFSQPLEMYAVSTHVNSPAHEGPKCIAPPEDVVH